jgi:hypothetical protein
MTGGPPTWTYTVTFYPRTGHATVTYTVNDPTPYSADFDLQNMRGFENTITATEVEDYIRNARNGAYRNSPMLLEAGIGERFVTAGRNNNVNPSFLIATAELEGRFGVYWDNNGDGANDNWAYSHPEAHNTMGWGVPTGSTPPGPANTFSSWGDCIEYVAQQIASPTGYYYGSGLHTIHDVRGVYVGGPNNPNYGSVPFIVSYMNNLATFAGQAGEFHENFNLYVDPAGYVYDVNTEERISGASVWLQRPDGEGGWENIPIGQTPPIMQPDVNPQITGADGQYQWDVLEGSYRVHVEAPGYYPADSIVVTIPPPVTDLHVGLTPLPPPADGIPPTTTLTIGNPKYIDPSGNVYVASSTPFTLSAEDNLGGTGVASTFYRIYNSTYDTGSLEYSAQFHLVGLADGEYSIDYYSTDNIGNTEPTNTATVILDNTPPTTTLTIGEPKYISAKTYVTPDTPFTLEATDTGSGVYSTAYRVCNATYDSGWITYAGPVYLTSLTSGTYTIEFNSTDNVQTTETTHTTSVTLFHWNYIYQDTHGRGTTLKINLAHKFFQFTAPSKDYGIRNATSMRQCGRAIIINHCDKQLRLITASVDTKTDFCYAMAWDLQTRKCHLLIDKAGIE